MRKALMALVCATAGFGALAASTGPAAAWHSYRWYRDYAPLYPTRYYGPPVVYVVPPAYAYYPRPLYRYCPPYLYGPAGTYYPRPSTIRAACATTRAATGAAAAGKRRLAHPPLCATLSAASSHAGSNQRSASPS